MFRCHPSRVARWSLVAIASALTLSACLSEGSYSDSVNGPAAPGGEGTVTDHDAGAFSQPAANLSYANRSLFRIGDVFFTDPWSPATEGMEDRDGLGPTYLSTSCSGCHPADGRDTPPDASVSSGVPLIRFAGPDGDAVIDGDYGLQLQTRAVDGVPAEATVEVQWVERAEAYPDGAPFSLRHPRIVVTSPSFGSSGNDVAGIRLGPSLIGLGLLEAIPASDIRAIADPTDDDGDGVSGVASEVKLGDASELGRFGLKANVATVADQVAAAYLFDMGITSPSRPDENCPEVQESCRLAPSGGSPEISAERLTAVVLYAQTLGVPSRVGLGDESVIAGEQVFDGLGCGACHTKKWETGAHDVAAVSYQTIYPYTDLLLHDMGQGLSDGRSDGTASATEWRTTPLWGIGLARTVNPNAGFLHDGRARSIEEAILWHGGEGQASRDRFVELPVVARTLLLLFLKSL